MKKVIAVVLLAISSMACGSTPNFSNEQLDNLQFAYAFGEQYQKSGKFKEHNARYNNSGLGYIMAGLAWQESSAGVLTKKSKEHHAYGMFQNYLPTLRSRTKQLGYNMSDRQIIKMVNKRENSAAWAYIELSYWLEIHKGDMRKALSSYNAGWAVKAGNKYASDVLSKANYLKTNKMLHQTVE